jgi:hypothetical protein
MGVNYQHPRGRGIQSVEQTAPHTKLWNPGISLTWTNDELQTITETAEDGTQARITLTWSTGKLTGITKWTKL